ncbi:hypothetical protein QBC45DRAFT_395345 [Copromyces sp. CBS 386.78]|nr:hypothetical protein QBC45DRAFT_395345 [Copromyces sp. CBS 386.78]
MDHGPLAKAQSPIMGVVTTVTVHGFLNQDIIGEMGRHICPDDCELHKICIGERCKCRTAGRPSNVLLPMQVGKDASSDEPWDSSPQSSRPSFNGNYSPPSPRTATSTTPSLTRNISPEVMAALNNPSPPWCEPTQQVIGTDVDPRVATPNIRSGVSDRLTIMVRKYHGSRETMPQGYPYFFDPTWLDSPLPIPSALQPNPYQRQQILLVASFRLRLGVVNYEIFHPTSSRIGYVDDPSGREVLVIRGVSLEAEMRVPFNVHWDALFSGLISFMVYSPHSGIPRRAYPDTPSALPYLA